MSDTVEKNYQEQLSNAGPSVSEAPYTPDEPIEVPPDLPPVAGEVLDEGDEKVDTSQWEDYTVDELKAYTDEYDLMVTRTDGQSGDPLKEDYVVALEKWQKEQE